MAKNRQNYGVRKQIIMSAKTRTFVEKYLSPKGKRLIVDAKTKKEQKQIWDKYGKNRYRMNLDARPLRNAFNTGLLIVQHT
jgi:hypothetical protein